MKDRIFLEGVRLACRVGVPDEERREAQEILVDLSLFLDLRRAGTTDDLDQTVDYATVLQRMSELVAGREFRLLEGVAEAIASMALDAPGVERVVVRVRKARYSEKPILGVEIERSRGD